MSVFRIYSEKKPEFAVEAQSVLSDIKTALRLDIKNIRVLNRYDADRLTEEDFNAAISTVFSEPAVDVVYSELPVLAEGERVVSAIAVKEADKKDEEENQESTDEGAEASEGSSSEE